MNATINTNRKGELALTGVGLKRTPNLTADAVAAWEEIISETRGGAAGAVSKVGRAVSRAPLCQGSPAKQRQLQWVRQSMRWAQGTLFELTGSTESSP